MTPQVLHPPQIRVWHEDPAEASCLGVMFPPCSREDDGGDGCPGPGTAVASGAAEGCDEFVRRLRTGASAMVCAALLGRIEERAGGRVLAVPSVFVRDQIATRFAGELRARAVEVGVDRIELLVDEAVPEQASDSPTREPQPAAVATSSFTSVARVLPRTPATERLVPSGVVAKLLAERGYWSLSPSVGHVRVEDIKGSLVVIPGGLGACGVSEAIVFTALTTIWANGDRLRPVVETSLHHLAVILGLSWSGRIAELLRRSIERLKTTSYRATATTPDGGAERLFSILDEIETTWAGPQSSPHRRVRAVFSQTTMELVSAPRMLRPIDLAALRRLGAQRDVARRLFLFLEASTGHPLADGAEVVERIIDERLVATLGSAASPARLAGQLVVAAAAVESVTPRYRSVRVIERRKAYLAPGDARYALRAVRRRVSKQTSRQEGIQA